MTEKTEAKAKTTTNAKSSTQKQKSSVKIKSKKTSISGDEFISMVAKRAYELYLERGCNHGEHERDWYHAEKELQIKVNIAK